MYTHQSRPPCLTRSSRPRVPEGSGRKGERWHACQGAVGTVENARSPAVSKGAAHWSHVWRWAPLLVPITSKASKSRFYEMSANSKHLFKRNRKQCPGPWPSSPSSRADLHESMQMVEPPVIWAKDLNIFNSIFINHIESNRSKFVLWSKLFPWAFKNVDTDHLQPVKGSKVSFFRTLLGLVLFHVLFLV